MPAISQNIFASIWHEKELMSYLATLSRGRFENSADHRDTRSNMKSEFVLLIPQYAIEKEIVHTIFIRKYE